MIDREFRAQRGRRPEGFSSLEHRAIPLHMDGTGYTTFRPSALVEINDQAASRFQIRGLKVKTGLFPVGQQSRIETPSALAAGFDLSTTDLIGAFTYSWSRIEGVASIGRYCSIAGNVEFGGQEHPTDWLSTSSFTYDDGFIWGDFQPDGPFRRRDLPGSQRPPVIIGNDVWIGAGAYIKAGVIIGDGAIVGSRALVTKDVPPYAVVAGSPAVVIRYRFDEATIARLLRLRWWRFNFRDFDFDVRDVPASLDRLDAMIEADTISEYRPEPIRLLSEGLTRPLPAGFNADDYLSLNMDVALSGADPRAHYLEFGWLEGRPFAIRNRGVVRQRPDGPVDSEEIIRGHDTPARRGGEGSKTLSAGLHPTAQVFQRSNGAFILGLFRHVLRPPYFGRTSKMRPSAKGEQTTPTRRLMI